jgi:hypothetical protein
MGNKIDSLLRLPLKWRAKSAKKDQFCDSGGLEINFKLLCFNLRWFRVDGVGLRQVLPSARFKFHLEVLAIHDLQVTLKKTAFLQHPLFTINFLVIE